jgi:hypothetical protein
MNQMFRNVRIAFSVVCGIVCLTLVVLWGRSYWRCDIIEGKGATSTYFIFGSARGIIGLGGSPDFLSGSKITQWGFDSYPPDYDEPLPEPQFLGFHFDQNQLGTELVVPFWFPVLVTAGMAVFPWIQNTKRYSLRTLLIATTLVAVLLGAIVYALK